MGPFLLDANVLIALAWPPLVSHNRAARWFAKHAQMGWATCPFTETAFVRILSNPAFTPYCLSPAEALHLLQINLEHPRHEFWADSLSLSDAVKKLESRMRGHRQITDAYLVGLARHRKGRLATMDKGLAALAEAEDAGVVELIPRGSEFT